MPTSKYSHINTTTLPSNILDLRDEAFYGFVRQFSGKRVSELLAFQELNGVDSLLGCKDVTAVIHLQSDQLNDLKKNTCITLVDGTIALLPGLESSINILIKLLKKKREEINKRVERLQSITSSVLTVASSIPIVQPTAAISPPYPSIHTPSQSASLTTDPSNLSSHNSLYVSNSVTDEILNIITTNITDWMKKNEKDLNLINTDYQQGIDFHVELNQRRDGVIVRCKCGSQNTICQKQGILVFSNIFRHFKSGKCSLIIEKQRNSINHQNTDDDEDDTNSTLMATAQSTSSNSHQLRSNSIKSTASKGNRRTRSTSVTAKNKRQRRK